MKYTFGRWTTWALFVGWLGFCVLIGCVPLGRLIHVPIRPQMQQMLSMEVDSVPLVEVDYIEERAQLEWRFALQRFQDDVAEKLWLYETIMGIARSVGVQMETAAGASGIPGLGLAVSLGLAALTPRFGEKRRVDRAREIGRVEGKNGVETPAE